VNSLATAENTLQQTQAFENSLLDGAEVAANGEDVMQNIIDLGEMFLG
jgi:hypothetical protein